MEVCNHTQVWITADYRFEFEALSRFNLCLRWLRLSHAVQSKKKPKKNAGGQSKTSPVI